MMNGAPDNTNKVYTLWRFVLDYLTGIELGPAKCNQLLAICWNVLAHKKTLWKILSCSLTMAILVVVIVQFELVHAITDASFSTIICIFLYLSIQFSSVYRMHHYANILRSNHETNETIWQLNASSRQRQSIPMKARTILSVLELICGLCILYELLLWYFDLVTVGLSYPYTLLFWGLSIMKLTECFLGSLLFVFICPLQKTWMEYATTVTKQQVIQLTPWVCYYITHNLLLTITLRSISLSLGLFHFHIIIYIILYTYFFFKLFWLTFLTLQISNTSLVPVIRHPEADFQLWAENQHGMTGWVIDSKSEVITGFEERKSMLAELPEKSVIVCGTIAERFGDVIKPLEGNLDELQLPDDESLLFQQVNPVMSDGDIAAMNDVLIEEEIAYNNNDYLEMFRSIENKMDADLGRENNVDISNGSTVTEELPNDEERHDGGRGLGDIVRGADQPLRQRIVTNDS